MILGSILFASLALGAPTASPISIVPRPTSIEFGTGAFQVDSKTSIVAAPKARGTAKYLQSVLRPATGFDFEIKTKGAGGIQLVLDPKLTTLGEEGYLLVSNPKGVLISASTQTGLFYGVQTLRQLLPTEIFRASNQTTKWAVPAVTIEDSPRFGWRGAHLDVGRYFMPKEFVLKYIDLLAVHKMNMFHWHLTEDQGWRIEIKKYPRLTEVGAWRKDSMLTYSPETYSGKPHGGFYTQEDVREIVAYAAERHITVMPEIEMPGHAQAAIAAYPELGNTGKQLEVYTKWGVSNDVFNTEPKTIQFLQDVLTEVMELFPSKFIHIGGDECPKSQWKTSKSAQAKIKELGLKDEHELQSWFISQMDKFLTSKGRRLMGWSEILEGGLAPGATLMVWLGDDGALAASGSGHDVVMAQNAHTYYDHYQTDKRDTEPWAIGGNLPLEKAYAYEPILPQMSAEQAKHVLGVQSQCWTEYMPDEKRVEYMVFPRACAMSEIGWTQRDLRDYPDFSKRMDTHLQRLTNLDVNYRGRGNSYPYPLKYIK
ncbi:MAG: beta-N-acetylhexosaminidase [Armatimonadetes bacterium]|nr:beta-N-acetylhexosaminidase [Armatimonadota bacterium]